MIERATTATAIQLISTCEPCRDDFKSTHDILDAVLEELETRQDLASALSWMRVPELVSPEGSLIIEPEDVMLIMNPDPISRPVPDSMIYNVGLAVWVGLNKAKL
jgi:hypothetical protein